MVSFAVISMYVRREKFLSLAFMHSPVMCSAFVPAINSAKAILNRILFFDRSAGQFE